MWTVVHKLYIIQAPGIKGILGQHVTSAVVVVYSQFLYRYKQTQIAKREFNGYHNK